MDKIMAVEQQTETPQLRIVAGASKNITDRPVDHIFMVENESGEITKFLTPYEFEKGARKGTLPGKIDIGNHHPCPACLAEMHHVPLERLTEIIPKTSGAVILYQ